MKWMMLALAALALSVSSPSRAPGASATVPNFSGTWEVDKSRSTVQSERPFAAMATQGMLSLVIDHREPELKIEQHASLMITERTVVTTYHTDGRPSSNRNARGDTAMSTSHWDNGALVTDVQVVRGRGAGAKVVLTRRDVMSLSEDGKSLIMESTRTDPGVSKPESIRLVFVRK